MAESRWAKINGQMVKQTHQPEGEVDAVLDLNRFTRNNPTSAGGRGSKEVKFLARIPLAMAGQWTHEWRLRGGLEGTGMKAQEFCVLKASTPNYSELIATPSGKTGFEKQARRLAMGYGGRVLKFGGP